MNTDNLIKHVDDSSVEKLGFHKFSFNVKGIERKMTVELALDAAANVRFIVHAEDVFKGTNIKIFDDVSTDEQRHFVRWNLKCMDNSNKTVMNRELESELVKFMAENDI